MCPCPLLHGSSAAFQPLSLWMGATVVPVCHADEGQRVGRNMSFESTSTVRPGVRLCLNEVTPVGLEERTMRVLCNRVSAAEAGFTALHRCPRTGLQHRRG